VLDDVNVLKQRDPQDALGVSAQQWEYLKNDFDVSIQASAPIANVVLGGMGGSALFAVAVSTWPRVNVPFEIVRNYTLPDYVNEHTLFIASSYSGNTEEALEALHHAEKKGAQIVVLAAGGKLMDIAKEKGYPLFAIMPGIQPRMATLYFLNALTKILAQLGLTEADGTELAAEAEWLHAELDQLTPNVTTAQNIAKQIALQLVGKTVIMYAGPLFYPAANKWKICLNENAKNTAWLNSYPEFNHNEFIGWSSHPVEKPFAVVEIRSKFEHPRIQKRFEVSERLLSGKRPSPIVVEPRGDTLLRQLLWSIAMGDFVGTYVAILNNVNPTPVDLVEKLKVELG
jgi:glucose/mannose-6-phosphate isomerase